MPSWRTTHQQRQEPGSRAKSLGSSARYRRHVRQTDRNVPFDLLCAATSYVHGKRACSTDRHESEEPAEPGRWIMPTPLGIWPGRGGPGDCCCSSSGLPPRSWLPWWPRPPCCPSPSRHSGSPALRCLPCRPRQPRRLHRPPPQATGGRPPRLPLPPLRPLGGESSADRPRPPDRPRPKRRRPSTARPPPRRSRPRAPPPPSPP